MKALIAPNEIREKGYRVAQVQQQEFEVALPLFWVDCPEDLLADSKWFDPLNNSFNEFSPVDPKTSDQPTTTGTQTI